MSSPAVVLMGNVPSSKNKTLYEMKICPCCMQSVPTNEWTAYTGRHEDCYIFKKYDRRGKSENNTQKLIIEAVQSGELVKQLQDKEAESNYRLHRLFHIFKGV